MTHSQAEVVPFPLENGKEWLDEAHEVALLWRANKFNEALNRVDSLSGCRAVAVVGLADFLNGNGQITSAARERARRSAVVVGVATKESPRRVLPAAGRDHPLYATSLSKRIRVKLLRGKAVTTLGSLANLTVGQILALPRLSVGSVQQIRAVLAEYGYKLRGD